MKEELGEMKAKFGIIWEKLGESLVREEGDRERTELKQAAVEGESTGVQERRGEGQTQRSEEGAQTDDRRGEIEEERMEEGENQEGEKPSYREVLQGRKGKEKAGEENEQKGEREQVDRQEGATGEGAEKGEEGEKGRERRQEEGSGDREGDSKKRKEESTGLAGREVNVVVLGNSMVRGIGEELSKLLGKGFKVRVVSMPGAKIGKMRWELKDRVGDVLGGEKVDCIVIHSGTNHINSGDESVQVGFIKGEVRKMMEEVDRDFGKGIGIWSGIVPRGDVSRGALMGIECLNSEISGMAKLKGWGFVSHWGEFFEGGKIREELFRPDRLHLERGEGKDTLIREMGRGIIQWV